MPFDFNLKRDEINDAHGSFILSIANLTMTNLALGDLTNNIGQADTFYTDNPISSPVNTANSDMFTNYAPNNFSIPTDENSSYFTNTFAGDPMPLRDNVTSGDFHGTCKPVALGDYINNSSLGSALNGSFATAGISGGDVYVSVFKTDAASTPMVPVWDCRASCGFGSTLPSLSGALDSDIRLFAYPGLDVSSNQKAIVVIVNDFGNGLYFFMFSWDYSAFPSPGNLTLITNITISSSAAGIIDYTGQHDIFYLPTSKNLFLLRKDKMLEEIFIDPPSSTLTHVNTLNDITAVAYDYVSGVFVTTDTSGDLKIYTNTTTSGPGTTVGGPAVLSTVFDGCYNATVDLTGFYFCAIDSSTNELISYRFDINSGTYNFSNSYATTGVTTTNWTQVETQAFNVINVGVGPNNTTSVKTARVVCDSTTLRPTFNEYDNVDVEDFILMRHPSGIDNSINNNPASGSNHLICVGDVSNITTHSKNFLNEVETLQPTTVFFSKHQYIIYLGYCYNSATSKDNYLYLALASNIVVSYDSTGNPTGGYYLYFNYDA